uniref:Phosphoinositide 3-kinase regulatory subunit 5 n=1 Tax=Sander lucioperca TaxID=283035 RepID=A0A8C9XQ04_SANLU
LTPGGISCTEDRIQHVLERCLCGLGLDTPDKQLWNAGLCVNRWCLEELVKRDPHNFLILLQKILRKTKEVLEQCQYELVVPLTLLFSSTLLKAPHVAPEVLQEAHQLFHSFLAWPEPCSSASKRLLNIIQQELRAPGSTDAHPPPQRCGGRSGNARLPHCLLSSVESIVQTTDSPPGVLKVQCVTWLVVHYQNLCCPFINLSLFMNIYHHHQFQVFLLA